MIVEIVNFVIGQVMYCYELFDVVGIEQCLVVVVIVFLLWMVCLLQECGGILCGIVVQLCVCRDDIQQVMIGEMGKFKGEVLVEIEKCVQVCEYYVDYVVDYFKLQLIDIEVQCSYVCYELIGCVFVVMLWNFLIWQVFCFFVLVFMVGNVVLFKYVSNVLQCVDLILVVCCDGGLLDGVFDVLYIDNDQVVEVLCDRWVKVVMLIGSECVGCLIVVNVGDQFKKCVMELGGSDVFVVFDDVDLDKIVVVVVKLWFDNSGQICIVVKCFVVVDVIVDVFVVKFVVVVVECVYGDLQDDRIMLVLMVCVDLCDELYRQVQVSVVKGVIVLFGGELVVGLYVGYLVIIFDYVVFGMLVYDEELFGLVVVILCVCDDVDVLCVVNDIIFGFGGSVWSGDLVCGEVIVKCLECGVVFVNVIVKSDVCLLFGGIKCFGFGCELVDYGIYEFMNIKMVYVV